jgi:phosphoribosylanthranilate isomerase
VQLGAHALGLVSHMPSGPGVIDDALIANILATVPPPMATFLLTPLVRADDIAALHARCPASTLQLVDAVDETELRRLRRLLPGIKLVQVIHVLGPQSLDEARAVAPHVDAVLLDSGNPNLTIKELGGTGRVHDWQNSRQIREQLTVPVFLAGGLNAGNAAQAIRDVQPFGLDVCSGVRQDGRLSAERLTQFMRAARGPH